MRKNKNSIWCRVGLFSSLLIWFFFFCVQAWWWGSVHRLIKQLLTQTRSCTSIETKSRMLTETCLYTTIESRLVTSEHLWNSRVAKEEMREKPYCLAALNCSLNFWSNKLWSALIPHIFIPILRQKIQDMVRGPLNVSFETQVSIARLFWGKKVLEMYVGQQFRAPENYEPPMIISTQQVHEV